MELLQLKYFSDAAVTENFSKTAKKFMVPPSAVSQSIQRLEKELGILLFERKGNRIILNENGKIFFHAVTQSQKILSDAKKKLLENSDELSGEIRILVLCNRSIVSDAIRQFKQLYPKVTFVLNHSFSDSQHFDLVVADNYFPIKGYSKKTMITEDIALAFSKNHFLAKQTSIRLPDLVDQRFITMSQNSSLYHLTQLLCHNAGFSPKISIECDDPVSIREYIEMDMGISFVPLYSWKHQLSDKIICKKLSGCTRTTFVYWDDSRYMTNASTVFMELLLDICSDER